MAGTATAIRESTAAARYVSMPPFEIPIMPDARPVDVGPRLEIVDEPHRVPDRVVEKRMSMARAVGAQDGSDIVVGPAARSPWWRPSIATARKPRAASASSSGTIPSLLSPVPCRTMTAGRRPAAVGELHGEAGHALAGFRGEGELLAREPAFWRQRRTSAAIGTRARSITSGSLLAMRAPAPERAEQDGHTPLSGSLPQEGVQARSMSNLQSAIGNSSDP